MTGITVLGPVTVEDEGAALSPRDRVVLSVLVSRRGQEVAAETIAEALWGEHLPVSWAKVVQGCVARLRRRLGHTVIVTGPSGYRLQVSSEDVDAARFERLVRHARELLTLDHPDQAAWTADEALRLWRGRPLTELEDWEPGRGEAERLTELRLQAEEVRLDGLLSSGRHAEVLPEATLRVQEQPLREHRWALLTRAQYQDGRQAEALDTLRRARDVLAEELGLDPGGELVGLERAVLQQDPTLAVRAAPAQAAVCPWPGLECYDVADADTFFGREVEVTECLERLARTGFLAVVGPSGSGKSSLARAGLAARLRLAGREVRVVTPGPRPLDALATATAGDLRGGVLVVDQCEEILAGSVPETVRATFLQRICELASHGQTQVILTLRADRLGELAAYPDLARLVQEGLYLLTSIGPDGVRLAIERPARQAGLLLEQGLVDLLVRDVEGEPGSLPLLAHALRQTWERREGSTLTVAGYRASGGIRGAIAVSAEQVYESASGPQRHALRELLLRMVQPGPGGDPVRTSVPRDTFDDEQHAAIVEQLVRARLVTVGADRLEIAHEALARAWPRLQSWLADDVQGELIRHHLAAAATAWQAMGRPESELYRGARLAAAREWRDAGRHTLGRVEQQFLAASQEAHRSQLARAQDEARRQRRLNRVLRLVVAGAVVLALVAAAFGAVAGLQWREARTANGIAQSEAARARSHELAASAVAAVEEDPALARALAVLGADAAPATFQSRDALHRAVAADRVVSRISMSHDTERLWAVLHPEGSRVAMTGESGYSSARAVEVHNVSSGDLVWEWVVPDGPGHESAVVAGAQYSPDGSLLATGVLWHPEKTDRIGPPSASAPPPADGLVGVHLWDGRTHDPLGVVDVGPCGGWPLAVAGEKVLVRTLVGRPSLGLDDEEEAALQRECRWADGAMGTVVVDRTTGESQLLTVVEALNLDLTVGHALSDDGSLAVVPDFVSGSGVLYDTTNGREAGRLDGAFGFDFDSSSERLLVLDRSDPLRYRWQVVSLPDLTPLATFNGHQTSSFYGRFGPDDTTVFTTGLDNVLLQWSAATGETLRELPATGSGPPTSAGRHVLVPRPDTRGAVLVDTAPPGELWSVPSCLGTVDNNRLRVADRRVVVARDCGGEAQGRLETLTTSGAPLRSWPGVSWEALEVSPDGRSVVSRDGAGTDDELGLPRVGPLRIRDLATGKALVTLDGLCEHTLADMFTGIHPDDPALQDCGRVGDPPFTFATWAVRWSPDGRWIAAVDSELGNGVPVWDARTGELVASVATAGSPEAERWTSVYDLRFSPDSDRLLLSTGEGQLVALDTSTWAPVEEQQLDLQNAGSTGVVGYAAEGSLVLVTALYQNTADPALVLVDPETLVVRRTWSGVAEGTVQAADLSPDGTRIALATSEGVINVWDLASQALVDRADPGLGRLAGVQWLDDKAIVAISLDGHLTTVTTDAERLLDLARRRVTRGLSEPECASYAVDPCPSLADLRQAPAVVPEGLRGSYVQTWTDAELHDELVGQAQDTVGELDEGSLERLAGQAERLAGSYRLDLRASGYTMTRTDVGEVWCSGSVTASETRPGRFLLGADTGARCTDFHYAEIGWELDGDRLLLPRDDFRGGGVDRVLWTSKPLERVG